VHHAANQDALGVQGVPVGDASDVQSCWKKPLANGDVAVIVLNTGDTAADVTCTFTQLRISGKVTKVRDLLGNKVGPTPSGSGFTTHLESHDHLFLRVTVA
jgi:alpha-galactosidase